MNWRFGRRSSLAPASGPSLAAFYAAGVSGAGLEQMLKTIGFKELYKIVLDFSILSNSAIFTGKKVEEFLARQIPAQTFEEVEIPLKVVATDFWNRREVIFESGSLITAIRASWPCRQFSNQYSSTTKSS